MTIAVNTTLQSANNHRDSRDIHSALLDWTGANGQQKTVVASGSHNGIMLLGFIRTADPGIANPRLIVSADASPRTGYVNIQPGGSAQAYAEDGLCVVEAGTDFRVSSGTATDTGQAIIWYIKL